MAWYLCYAETVYPIKQDSPILRNKIILSGDPKWNQCIDSDVKGDMRYDHMWMHVHMDIEDR